MTYNASHSVPLAMVAAFRWEVSALLRRQRNIIRLEDNHFRFLLNGKPVVLAIAGAGAENAYHATSALVRKYSVAGSLSIGFAGGLCETVKVGELVVADVVIDERTGEHFPCQMHLLPIDFGMRGRLLSVVSVVNSAEAKRALGSRWDAVAVDMESIGVARASKEMGLPFGAIKSITDASDQSIAIDFQRCRSDDEGLSSWRIVREGIASPRGIRSLWKLASSSRRAAGKLALALCSV
ncbi:MAG: hypothetical protein HYX73_01580 [Acidobacteria bacterium]|nr:hypothetical protein [Acidobacteriota bacterium]